MKSNWTGIHTESTIFHTLFIILLYDVLFMDVPQVFQTPYQSKHLQVNCFNNWQALRWTLEHITFI